MRLFLPLLAALALGAQTPPKPAEPAKAAVGFDKVVMTVGNEKVTVGDVENFIDALPAQYRANARGAGRRNLAEQFARMKLLAQEAVKRKLDRDEEYRRKLSYQRDTLLVSALVQHLQGVVQVDDESVRKFYDEHRSEYEQVRARHILIRMTGTAVPPAPDRKELSEEEALAKIQGLRKRVLAGEDFAEIAKAESDDKGSGAAGGDLGFFRHGQMVPAFEQVAYSLAPGQVSEPVKTQFGYHLIRVEQKDAKTFDELRPDLETRMRPELARRMVEEIRKKAAIDIDEDYFGPAEP